MTPSDQPYAVVTGAAGGIGRAIAQRLARDGFHVIALDLHDAAVRQLADEIRSAGGRADGRAVDLRDDAALAALVASLPRIDALVNNAGIFDERAFMELTADDFHRHYDVNVIALFRLSQHAARRMKPRAKIVNIASRAWLGARNHAHYVAAKAAVVGLTRAMAMELMERGILVNAVAPGLVDTPLLKALTPERRAAQLALQPTGRAARPEDVAHAVAFLASPQTDFITGQTLLVDGGKSLGGSI